MSEELILQKVETLVKKIDKLTSKVDDLVNPKDGVITELQKFQASCPRKSLKWIWFVIIPVGLANVATSVAAIAAILKIT